MSSTSRDSFVIPTEPWTQIEDVIEAIGLHSLRQLENKLARKTIESIVTFLENVKFVENFELTGAGLEYFRARFLLNDIEASSAIISGTMKDFEPTQAICQLFWGRPNLKRDNVYKLLVAESYVDPENTKESDLGSYMMLLNHCEILRYSKKTSDVTVLYNPRTSIQLPQRTKFLSPETPFSNLRIIWDALRTCHGFVYWFDKNFSTKGLELLGDEADGNIIDEVRILSGILEQGPLEKLRRDFKRFKEEMTARKITCSLRVISNKEQLHKIHDRWIISKDVCYNIPPVNSIYMGQYSEVKRTSYRPPFIEWWDAGLDIIDNWEEIQRAGLPNAEEVSTSALTPVTVSVQP